MEAALVCQHMWHKAAFVVSCEQKLDNCTMKNPADSSSMNLTETPSHNSRVYIIEFCCHLGVQRRMQSWLFSFLQERSQRLEFYNKRHLTWPDHVPCERITNGTMAEMHPKNDCNQSSLKWTKPRKVKSQGKLSFTRILLKKTHELTTRVGTSRPNQTPKLTMERKLSKKAWEGSRQWRHLTNIVEEPMREILVYHMTQPDASRHNKWKHKNQVRILLFFGPYYRFKVQFC